MGGRLELSLLLSESNWWSIKDKKKKREDCLQVLSLTWSCGREVQESGRWQLKEEWDGEQGKVGRVLGGGYDGKARQLKCIPLDFFLLRPGSGLGPC